MSSVAFLTFKGLGACKTEESSLVCKNWVFCLCYLWPASFHRFPFLHFLFWTVQLTSVLRGWMFIVIQSLCCSVLSNLWVGSLSDTFEAFLSIVTFPSPHGIDAVRRAAQLLAVGPDSTPVCGAADGCADWRCILLTCRLDGVRLGLCWRLSLE